MAEEKANFVWWRDIPIWLGGLSGPATIALVVVAIVQIGPLLEKERLQREVLELEREKKSLSEGLETAKREQELLNKNIKMLTEDVERRQKQSERVYAALENVSKNISEQVERERRLSEENRRLAADNKQLREQSTNLADEKRRLEEERAQGVAVNRRRILEDLRQRLAGITFNPRRIASLLGVNVIHEEELPWATTKFADLKKGFVVPGSGGVYDPTTNRRAENGRDLVTFQFGTPGFGVLPEPEQKRLKADIVIFMDDRQNAAVFAAPLFRRGDLIKEKFEIRDYLRKYDEGSGDAQKKAAMEARLKEIEAHEKQIDDNRDAFHEALGRMVDALAPPA